MKSTWRTLWQQNDIVVFRDEIEVDRLPADRIERVCLLYGGNGDSPGDIVQSVVQFAGDEGYALFDAHTGFAGRGTCRRPARSAGGYRWGVVRCRRRRRLCGVRRAHGLRRPRQLRAPGVLAREGL